MGYIHTRDTIGESVAFDTVHPQSTNIKSRRVCSSRVTFTFLDIICTVTVEEPPAHRIHSHKGIHITIFILYDINKSVPRFQEKEKKGEMITENYNIK